MNQKLNDEAFYNKTPSHGEIDLILDFVFCRKTLQNYFHISCILTDMKQSIPRKNSMNFPTSWTMKALASTC